MDELSAARTVLVLQGGGALGAYQGGVFETLAECGAQPSWLAGISIGAINSAIIAGNPPERRVERLHELWDGVTAGGPTEAPAYAGDWGRALFNAFSAGWVATVGVPGLFTPRVPPAIAALPGTPQALSVYDTAPLKDTLERLVDFDLINAGKIRLSVGAVNIRTGNFTYFDNAKQKIGPEHIMASAALPPGFPPIEIDGEFYWDGGVVSNTPLQYVLDESREDLLIFQVDLFSARGPLPRTLADVIEREKDIRYSSRTRLNTDAQLGLQQIKLELRKLLAKLPDKLKDGPEAQRLEHLSRENTVSVVQLVYRDKPYEGSVKDYDFSRPAMLEHWASGVADVRETMRHKSEFLAKRAKTGVETFDIGRDRGNLGSGLTGT